ncbi:MAG: NADH:ubiquinone oxidoreductase [Bacteroidetes bacterium]|nr:NADH:ubiquinone oxidoreductase [Bacteroidota bacterium]
MKNKDVPTKERKLSREEIDINEITYEVIGASMKVYNSIGRGFLEAVYADCLMIEFNKRKINYEREKKFEILYDGIRIPHSYKADFLVENRIILEIKAQKHIIEENTKQILNYLAVSKCKMGLLINFWRRFLKV